MRNVKTVFSLSGEKKKWEDYFLSEVKKSKFPPNLTWPLRLAKWSVRWEVRAPSWLYWVFQSCLVKWWPLIVFLQAQEVADIVCEYGCGVCKVLEKRIGTKIVIGGLALRCSHNTIQGQGTAWGGGSWKSGKSTRIFEKAKMVT